MRRIEPEEITTLLRTWAGGDQAALESLIPLVYQELRSIARRHLRNEKPGQTLRTTALVNEAYLRLAGVDNVDWRHRSQFFAICAQIMRHILVDSARARSTHKRGRGMERVAIDPSLILSAEADDKLLALDDVLEAFAKLAPRQAKVLEMRYFGGFTDQEIASGLNLSIRTVERDFRFAKSWLTRELDRK